MRAQIFRSVPGPLDKGGGDERKWGKTLGGNLPTQNSNESTNHVNHKYQHICVNLPTVTILPTSGGGLWLRHCGIISIGVRGCLELSCGTRTHEKTQFWICGSTMGISHEFYSHDCSLLVLRRTSDLKTRLFRSWTLDSGEKLKCTLYNNYRLELTE